jgi:probable F420-dependent oxidoreductase
VLVLPQRQPVLLAKQVASIDVLSRGRLTVGIGVGYVAPELQAMGVSLAERGARTDEHLAVMRTLWTDEHPAFDGRFVSFSDVFQRPFPLQRPYPPVLVGGHSRAAMRRAVTAAQGWYGVFLDVSQTADALAQLHAVAAECERPAHFEPLEITVTPRGPVDAASARRYADLGVHRLVVQPATEDGSDIEELIDTVGGTVLGRV